MRTATTVNERRTMYTVMTNPWVGQSRPVMAFTNIRQGYDWMEAHQHEVTDSDGLNFPAYVMEHVPCYVHMVTSLV